MSDFAVGSVVPPHRIGLVPVGARVELIPGGFKILELPEPTEAEKLAEELLQGFSYMSQTDRETVAEWILARFERKDAQGGYVLDREGDKWLPAQGGGYALRGVGSPWSVSDIRDKYGVDSRSPIQ